MPATLDMFLPKEKKDEERKQAKPESSTTEENKAYEKIYIVTPTAYEKCCSKCRMLLKAEEIESPMFRYCIFCKAEYCIRKD